MDKNLYKMRKRHSGIYNKVFYPSLCMIIFISTMGTFFPETSNSLFTFIQSYFLTQFGWMYILAMAIVIIICLFIMTSRLGDIKLGYDHSTPDYNYLTWFSMLFSAGIGIGLLFYGVSEPLMHFIQPPTYDPLSIEAAQEAINITFFHWGLEAWGIYSLMGLSFAYFKYRHNMPILPRSSFVTILGQHSFGIVGDIIDIFTVIGTVLGISATLGIGIIQLNSGLHYLFDVDINTSTQIFLLFIITILASISVATGLNKGIKYLSNINMILCIFLMVFVLLFGQTNLIMQSFVQNIGAYLGDIVGRTFNLYVYTNNNDWLNGWTLFYWGWWISWSPFVGMFIASISKGRTIREFLIGVLLAPVLFTFLWMTIFGNSAIDIVSNHENGKLLLNTVTKDISLSLFQFLDYFPLSSIVNIIALILIITFFITSADSASLIVDILTTANAKKSILWQRVMWCLIIGMVGISLIISGGLQAIQTATILGALPILITIPFLCISLIKALKNDYLRITSTKSHQSVIQYDGASDSWQQRLDTLLSFPDKTEAQTYLSKIAIPAMGKLYQRLKKRGVDVYFSKSNYEVTLKIKKDEFSEFIYSIKLLEFPTPDFADNQEEENTYYRAEVFLAHGNQQYDVLGYTESQITADLLNQYEKYLYFLHLSSSKDHNS